MKERPILFSAPMVRALLDGSKTQTRRAMNPQPPAEWSPANYGDLHGLDRHGELTPDKVIGWGPVNDDGDQGYTSPKGQPGDRLYVRENGWQRPERTAKMMREGADTWKPYYFDADGLTEQDVADFKAWGFKRRPSIHMPRAHSRILLEVVSVRVERLQDISEADAMAEGAPPSHPSIDKISREYGYADFSRSWYAQLWETINGPGSWDANPWVWVVEFSRAPTHQKEGKP